MSHVTMSKARINDTEEDLQAVELACKMLGLEFCRGQTHHEWFNTWVNDYSNEDAAYKLGHKPENYGKCSHAIRLPARAGDKKKAYEVGLVKTESGSFALVFDAYGGGHRVKEMLNIIGNAECPKLMQTMSLCKVTAQVAKQRDHYIKRIDDLENGRKKIVIGIRQGDKL